MLVKENIKRGRNAGFTPTPMNIGVSSEGERGFMLFEALIYIALFSVIIGGGLLASFQIIEGTRRIEAKTVIEAEANFLLRKFDWALTGSSVTVPVSGFEGPILTVQKGTDTFTFEVDVSGVVTINGTLLSSSRVAVSDLLFSHIPKNLMTGRPAAIETHFMINGVPFGTTTKFIRIP